MPPTRTLRDTHISLAHGNGGRLMRDLIDELFAASLKNPHLDTGVDAVGLPVPSDAELVVTTDGFTVQPLEFPGGNIGSLTVHGTVNDLAVSGATPRFMTLSAFLEEGLELALLRRVIKSLADAARDCGVAVVAGDTKVVGRGECDGIYLSATGIGFRPPSLALGAERARAGDRILVSGPIGDHGAAVMLARQEFGLRGDLESDAASVLPQAQALMRAPGLRFMRDPTRGGLATVAHELARATGLAVRLDERSIPVNDAVQSVCELLGFDPLFLACEGRVVSVVAPESADTALDLLRTVAPQAAMIGELSIGSPQVILETAFGGQRTLDELEDDPLPRIC
ncbi:MAG TPA: hydrogenase expression/formation protein HypE [Steroidobacteraceae bacterium]|nr:hydrogenase expression/formation protein HypE [Steroidobacteraceae bacterium]